MENLRDLLKKALETDEEIYGIIAEVEDVDVDEMTCDVSPLNGDADIIGVKLKTGAKTSGILLVPKIGSLVIVNMLTKEDGFVAMFSEIDQALINIEDIQFNGGANGGLIKIAALQTQIAKITAFMNLIKNTWGSAVPVASDGGAAIKAAFISALAAMETPDLSAITNDKVKH